ncbi:putative amino acid transporter, transmembrane domain-containing protein [Dioscorea sansibarensis]
MKAPLLPELHSPATGGASVLGAVFNIATSIIGAGIMSIPATMGVLGVIPALLVIAAVALLSDSSVEFLTRYIGNSAGSDASISYAGLMRESFGRLGSIFLQLCVALTNAGALVMYLIIIGDVMAESTAEGVVHLGVLQEWFGRHWWNTREFALFIITFCIMGPLSLFRRVDSFRFSSAISVLLAVVFMCISSALAIYALFQGTAQSPRLLPDFSNQSFLELFTAVPVIVVAFTFHFNVHPIRAELDKSSDMTMAVRISLLICTVIYATIGLFGYLLFGESTMADILSNFDRSSGSAVSPVLNDIVRLSYAFHLMLVYPLLNYSLRLNIDELFFPRARPLTLDKARFVSLTVILLGAIYLAAIVIPSIWTLFQFSGSTTAVCLSLIFPGAIALRDIHGMSTRRDKALAAIMIVLGVVTSSIAIVSNVFTAVAGE